MEKMTFDLEYPISPEQELENEQLAIFAQFQEGVLKQFEEFVELMEEAGLKDNPSFQIKEEELLSFERNLAVLESDLGNIPDSNKKEKIKLLLDKIITLFPRNFLNFVSRGRFEKFLKTTKGTLITDFLLPEFFPLKPARELLITGETSDGKKIDSKTSKILMTLYASLRIPLLTMSTYFPMYALLTDKELVQVSAVYTFSKMVQVINITFYVLLRLNLMKEDLEEIYEGSKLMEKSMEKKILRVNRLVKNLGALRMLIKKIDTHLIDILEKTAQKQKENRHKNKQNEKRPK